MRRPIVTLIAAMALAGLGFSACGDDEGETTTVTETTPAATSSSTTSTTSSTSTTTDSTTSTTESTTTGSTTTESEDVSGNCDEAEHADDPECAAGGVGADDSSGSGSGGYGPG